MTAPEVTRRVSSWLKQTNMLRSCDHTTLIITQTLATIKRSTRYCPLCIQHTPDLPPKASCSQNMRRLSSHVRTWRGSWTDTSRSSTRHEATLGKCPALHYRTRMKGNLAPSRRKRTRLAFYAITPAITRTKGLNHVAFTPSVRNSRNRAFCVATPDFCTRSFRGIS